MRYLSLILVLILLIIPSGTSVIADSDSAITSALIQGKDNAQQGSDELWDKYSYRANYNNYSFTTTLSEDIFLPYRTTEEYIDALFEDAEFRFALLIMKLDTIDAIYIRSFTYHPTYHAIFADKEILDELKLILKRATLSKVPGPVFEPVENDQLVSWSFCIDGKLVEMHAGIDNCYIKSKFYSYLQGSAKLEFATAEDASRYKEIGDMINEMIRSKHYNAASSPEYFAFIIE